MLILSLALFLALYSFSFAQKNDDESEPVNNSECLRKEFSISISPNQYYSLYGRTNYNANSIMFCSIDRPIEVFFNFDEEITNMQNSMQGCYSRNLDSFTCSITPKPRNVKFNKQMRCFSWVATSDDLGEYNYTIKVSNKYHTEEVPLRIRIVDDWTTSFIPNVGFTYFAPKNKTDFGTFKGASIQFDLVSWAHHNDNKGPCHGKLFLRFDYLESDKDTLGVAFKYGLGMQVSFERNANRSYLIPFYGVELSGINQREIGSLFLFNPHVGVWCYSNRNLNISATCGYLLPTKKVDDFSGLFASVSLGFSLW